MTSPRPTHTASAIYRVPLLIGLVSAVGLASALESTVSTHLESGQLMRVLDEWCPPFAGFHL